MNILRNLTKKRWVIKQTMYQLQPSSIFKEKYIQLVKKDNKVAKRIKKATHLLSQDPKHPSLKSHRVNTRHLGLRWSSTVTGDIRIIWDYAEDQVLVILLLDLGGHSGKQKVYR